MNPLSIRDALDLYLILKPHLPEKPDESGVRYVKDIVDSMAGSDPSAYLNSIMLMTGYTEYELEIGFDTLEIRDMFIEGLSINQIVVLAEFGRKLRL